MNKPDVMERGRQRSHACKGRRAGVVSWGTALVPWGDRKHGVESGT